ncbi:MAG: hypothetical protein DRP63_04535 [Planctomycetota bacterium]|nr:MAG: hypothetical protein DRP63_04535 [Planctomycetota bacterium]
MRWFLIVSALMVGMLFAQDRTHLKRMSGKKEDEDVAVQVSSGWVVINGRRVARLLGKRAVTIVVVDGKVYVNGREVKVPPAPPLEAVQHQQSILLSRLKALLRKYYRQLPEGLQRSLQRLLGRAKKGLERLPSTPRELKERTERWHREVRRWFERLEKMLFEDARRRMEQWLRRAPQEWLKRVEKWKRFLPEEAQKALDEWIRHFPREKVEKWLRPVEKRLERFVERMPPELRSVVEEIKRLEWQIERIKRQLEGLLRRYRGKEPREQGAPHLLPPRKRRLTPPEGLLPSLRKIRALRELLRNLKPEDIERFMKMAEEFFRRDTKQRMELLKRLIPEKESSLGGGEEEEEAGF